MLLLKSGRLGRAGVCDKVAELLGYGWPGGGRSVKLQNFRKKKTTILLCQTIRGRGLSILQVANIAETEISCRRASIALRNVLLVRKVFAPRVFLVPTPTYL